MHLMTDTGTPGADGPGEAAEAIAAAAAEAAVARTEGREFASFRCGCTLPPEWDHEPEAVRDAFRKDVVARMRRRLEAAWPGAVWDALAPELIVESLPHGDGPRVVLVPLYVAGRYRKLARGISQTVFLCRRCRGRRWSRETCEACGGTGRLCADSVEDFVVPPLVAAVRGRRGAFHGAGREDLDVRMLGRGRPFVVSVEDPWKRSIDAAALEEQVRTASRGRVEVAELRVVRRSDMARLTTDHGAKTYRALLVPDGGAQFPADAAARLAALRGAELRQRTPQRVSERRADAVRTKRVLDLAVVESDPGRMVLVLRTEPGTYVKELVSGDSGRTEPSAAALLATPCTCAELDVLDVEDAAEGAGADAATSSAR